MPSKTPAWAAQDGTLYPTAEEAGRRDLFLVLDPAITSADSTDAIMEKVIAQLIEHASTVVEALTTTNKSRPAARKKAGTTNPRRATKVQVQAGLTAMRAAVNGVDGQPTPPVEAT